MEVRNGLVWTNGIHGEVCEYGIWKKFHITSTSVKGDLSEDTKSFMRTKFEEFWDCQESINEV